MNFADAVLHAAGEHRRMKKRAVQSRFLRAE
jgi:hypothetical protein